MPLRLVCRFAQSFARNSGTEHAIVGVMLHMQKLAMAAFLVCWIVSLFLMFLLRFFLPTLSLSSSLPLFRSQVGVVMQTLLVLGMQETEDFS